MPTAQLPVTADALTFAEVSKDPKGLEWLWSPQIVGLYNRLLQRCELNRHTTEAAAGALQNITAGDRRVRPRAGPGADGTHAWPHAGDTRRVEGGHGAWGTGRESLLSGSGQSVGRGTVTGMDANLWMGQKDPGGEGKRPRSWAGGTRR